MQYTVFILLHTPIQETLAFEGYKQGDSIRRCQLFI